MQPQIGPDPQLYLADICTHYLAYTDFDQATFSKYNAYSYHSEDQESAEEDAYPLLWYAAHYWDSHIHTIDHAKRLLSNLEQILSPGKAEVWINQRRRYDRPRRLRDIALVFDIGWLAKIILTKVSPNLNDEFTPDCLVKAVSASGNVFKILLTDDHTKDI